MIFASFVGFEHLLDFLLSSSSIIIVSVLCKIRSMGPPSTRYPRRHHVRWRYPLYSPFAFLLRKTFFNYAILFMHQAMNLDSMWISRQKYCSLRVFYASSSFLQNTLDEHDSLEGQLSFIFQHVGFRFQHSTYFSSPPGVLFVHQVLSVRALC